MEKDTSEIAKLTERIAKDPKSKLFVPLAEEYKKAGDIEMAIQVLTDGLKSNPGYVTARSFLGRLLMDKGDLTGAQKELEEVIKAIPDNLLAQRKLGDLYVLQGKGSDAQQRYKAAFALNPADKELPSLLADLEAGRDISARIPRPKAAAPSPAPQSSPAPAAQTQPKAAPAVAAKPAVASPVPQAAAQKIEPAGPAAPKTSAAPVAAAEPAAQPLPAPPASPARDEVEVIEDIVEIEPLEQPGPAPAISGPVFAIPAEPQPEPAPPAAVSIEAPGFDLSETPETASADAGNAAAASWATEPFDAPAASREAVAPAGSDEGGDDLNTNTLAELYISQGFYDKAIEVYQGMLGERPGNKALQQKLEQLHAMAGTAGKGVEGFATTVRGPGEYAPPASAAFAEPRSPVEAPAEALTPAKEGPRPQEQAPVEAAHEKAVKETAPDSTAVRGPQAATMRRKETIDRLESWLQNIMKEKKE